MHLVPFFAKPIENDCYEIKVPDLPGCRIVASSGDNIKKQVQQGVEEYMLGELTEIPKLMTVNEFEELAKKDDLPMLFVEVNFDFLKKKAVPVNMTMPLYMKERIDEAARALGETRSAFLVKAAQMRLEKLDRCEYE